MENKFEEALKNKLNQLQMDGLGIKIEKEKEWEKLQQKSAVSFAPQRKIVWVPFWTHAAALIAGIIISGLLFSIFYSKNSDHPQPKITLNETKTPTSVDREEIQKQRIDTVYLVKEVAKSEQQKLKSPILKNVDAQEEKPQILSPDNLEKERNNAKKEGEIIIAQEAIQPSLNNEEVKSDSPPILYWHQIKEEIKPKPISSPSNTLLTYLFDKSMDVNKSHSEPQSIFDYLK